MRTDALLTLGQLLSATYPTGAFAYSHGLERAVADGIAGPATLERWLADVVEHGAGRSDAILLALAARAAEDLPEIAAFADALCPSRERRLETLQQGTAFAATTRAIWDLDLPDMALPVAVGRAASLLDLPLLPVTALWLQGFAANLVQCALRLMPLGQTDGQRILRRLAPRIAAVAEAAQTATLDDIGSASLAADISSMRHETMASRIFRT